MGHGCSKGLAGDLKTRHFPRFGDALSGGASWFVSFLAISVDTRETTPQRAHRFRMAEFGVLGMKNVYEVLRQKEMDLTRVRQEVEALRYVAPLLSEESEDQPQILESGARQENRWPLRIG
jgi:hypothetical protein